MTNYLGTMAIKSTITPGIHPLVHISYLPPSVSFLLHPIQNSREKNICCLMDLRDQMQKESRRPFYRLEGREEDPHIPKPYLLLESHFFFKKKDEVGVTCLIAWDLKMLAQGLECWGYSINVSCPRNIIKYQIHIQ